MIPGVDLHPVYQRGFDIERAVAEGIGFLAVKLSQGTAGFDGFGWLARAQAAGIPAVGYHYLIPGNEDAQARFFASQLAKAGGISGLLDAEALKVGLSLDATEVGGVVDRGGMGQHPRPDNQGLMATVQVRRGPSLASPALTMAGIRLFLARAAAYGANIPLLYLPSWYHQRMGRPSLAGLPPLWASSYPSRATGSPAELYRNVTPDRWAGYGGLNVAVLQYAETGLVAGRHPVDLDAYLGTRDQLAALLGLTPPEDIMASIDDLRAVIRTEVPPIVRTEAMDTQITRQGSGQSGTTTPRVIDAWTDAAWSKQRQSTDALTAQITALTAAMSGIDGKLDAILAAITSKPDSP